MNGPELHGERVWLRPIRPSDGVEIARASHLERETGFHESGRFPLSAMAMEAWIEGLGEREIVFAVCLAGEDTCIGTMSIRDIDRVNGTAETGSGLLHVEDRGRGLGTEAKRLVLRYAFEELGLHALRSTVFAGNTRSIGALRKQGYHLAGRLTANVLAAGGMIGDTLVFDITREDWERLSGV